MHISNVHLEGKIIEEIVIEHQSYIYNNLAYRLCNNRHDAEDLT